MCSEVLPEVAKHSYHCNKLFLEYQANVHGKAAIDILVLKVSHHTHIIKGPILIWMRMVHIIGHHDLQTVGE